MEFVKREDIPVIKPDVSGYWEIYNDGRKVWHADPYPQNYQPNGDDIEFSESDEIDLAN